jgi:hypothetical protein
MDRRQNARVTVLLPVEIWGMDAHGRPFTDPAVVINMSAGGIVLQGVRRRMRVGELLDVRMGSHCTRFHAGVGASPLFAKCSALLNTS